MSQSSSQRAVGQLWRRSHGIQGESWRGPRAPCGPVHCRGKYRSAKSARRRSLLKGPSCRWIHWNELLDEISRGSAHCEGATYSVHLRLSQASVGSLQTVAWSLRATRLSQRWHNCFGSQMNVSASVAVAKIAVSTCRDSRVGRMQWCCVVQQACLVQGINLVVNLK
jgi:hypothetical protein